jgi:hypothetical protein
MTIAWTSPSKGACTESGGLGDVDLDGVARAAGAVEEDAVIDAVDEPM